MESIRIIIIIQVSNNTNLMFLCVENEQVVDLPHIIYITLNQHNNK